MTSAGGDVKLVGQQVQLNVDNLPAGTYTFRARVVADNAAARADDLSFTIAAAPPTIVGAGEGPDFDWGFGRHATLAVPFAYKADGAVAQGDVLTTAHAFGAGDVPDTWRIMGQVGSGTPFEIQRDLENTFDGSVRTCSLAWAAPAALADGAEQTFTIRAENTAPNRTPHITAQGIAAATDFFFEHSGHDYAAAALRCSFNHIIATYPEADSSGGWGTNPVGGWRYTKRGPNVVGVHAWCYLRNPLNGATHRWVRDDIYVEARPGGKYKVGGKTWQPNAFAAHPAGTVGVPVTQRGLAANVELRNGSAVLYRWGGTSDPQAFDVAAASFGGNGLALPAGAMLNEARAHGVPVMFSGALPSGISAGTVYFLDNIYGSSSANITTQRLNSNSAIAVGTGGSGTIRVIPVLMTWPNCATDLMAADAGRVWVGTGSAPKIMPSHDQLYLSRRARLIPNYDLSYSVPQSGERAFAYVACSGSQFSSDWQAPSDDEAADRIGVIPYRHARSLRQPYDKNLLQSIQSQALCHAGHIWNIVDERSGQCVVHTRGPDGAGTPFPGMGANMTYFRAAGDNIGPTTTPAFGSAAGQPWAEKVGPGLPGIPNGYQETYHGSHATNFYPVPYLKTGDEIYLSHLESMAFTVAQGEYGIYQATGGRWVSGVFYGGNRTSAWTLNIVDDAACILPDAWPGKAVLHKVNDDNAYAYKDQALNGAVKHLGVVWNTGRPWMNAFHVRVVVRNALRGRHPEWATAAEVMAVSVVDFFDDSNVVDGSVMIGAYGEVNGINFSERDGNDQPYANLHEMFLSQRNFGSYAPFAWAGGYLAGRSGYARIVMAAMSDIATAHSWGVLSSPKALELRNSCYTHMTTPPFAINNNIGVETWSIVPALTPEPTAVPSVVTGAAASNVRAHAATVSWSRPSSGGPILTYRLRLKKGSGAFVLLDEDYRGAAIDLTDLLANAENVLEITAKNPVGASTAPVQVVVNTPVDPVESRQPSTFDAVGVTPVAAYSLRKMYSAYAGPAIRVRRSSDNGEADIGFAADGTLNQAALLAHVGANDGFVAKAYNQSGIGDDAVMTDPASQPRVVQSGTIHLMNGEPVMRFGVSGESNLSAALAIASPQVSLFAVMSMEDGSARGIRMRQNGKMEDFDNNFSGIFIGRQNNTTIENYWSQSENRYTSGLQSRVAVREGELFSVVSAADDAGAARLYANGIAGTPGQSVSRQNFGDCTLDIGLNWRGSIAEIVVLAGPISDMVRNAGTTNQTGHYGIDVV